MIKSPSYDIRFGRLFTSLKLLGMVGLGTGDSNTCWEEELIFIPNNLILLVNNLYGNIIHVINSNNNNKVS